MARDLEEFWQRFRAGIDVAVGGDLPDKLMGVRDGFTRYFGEVLRQGLAEPVSVAVVAQPQDEETTPLPLDDLETLELARQRARGLQEKLGDTYGFYVSVEAGLEHFGPPGEVRHFVRSWAVVRGLGMETWGSSGAVQLPEAVTHGLDVDDIPFAIPGRLRRGGMVSSLTGNLEDRRSSTAQATVHALSTLMYGLIESRPRGPHRR